MHYIYTLILLLFMGCGTADIRPDSMKESPPKEAQAEQLVRSMEKAHGIEEWRRYNFMQAYAYDEWFNILFYKIAAPYTENPENVFVSAYTHEFPTSRVELLAGKNKGETWVAEGEMLYRKSPGKEADSWNYMDKGLFASFVHGFPIWPNVAFIFQSADKFAYLGEESVDGRLHHKVFVSWGTFEPHKEIDQWILWIDAETSVLKRVWFTIRAAGKGQEGGYVIRKTKAVQGMVIPVEVDAHLKFDKDPLHTYVYRDVVFSKRKRVSLLDGIR